MSWVSIQEDIIKRLEDHLGPINDSPDAQTLKNRYLVLIEELHDKMRAVDTGHGHIAYRYSELVRDHEDLKRKLQQYAQRNSELRGDIEKLREELAKVGKKTAKLLDRQTELKQIVIEWKRKFQKLEKRNLRLEKNLNKGSKGKSRVAKSAPASWGKCKRCQKTLTLGEGSRHRCEIPVEELAATMRRCKKCGKLIFISDFSEHPCEAPTVTL